jgi:digeranylgeranylglycerophospholipid reductase
MAQIIYNVNEIFDVAIIGGGPAGLNAAYHCAKGGLKTIILEEHKEVGKPVHCGEGLSFYALKRLGLLDVPKEALGLEVKGVKVIFPDGTSSIFREKGYDLNKDLFEKYLLDRALAQGAQIKTSSRVESLSFKENLWTINSLSCVIKAKAVIDATGYQSLTNSLLKLNPKPLQYVSGAQYLMANVPSDGFIEFYLDPQLAPEGYLWIMPKNDFKANVGLVSKDPKVIHKNLKLFLEKRNLNKNPILRPFGGQIPCSGPLEKTYAEGLLLVGDAAGFTSPMFEGGTQLALKSGELAAQTLVELSNQNNCSYPFSEENLKLYEQKWKKEFPPYQKILKGKMDFYSFSVDDLNTIAKILPDDLTNLSLIEKIKILIRLFSIGKKLSKKKFFSAMNTFSYSTGKNYGW